MDEQTKAALAQWLGIPPDQVDQALADMFSSYTESADANDANAKQAAMMAQTPMPQGQMIGKHYIAPNPMQIAASAILQAKGLRGMDDAKKERGTMIDALRRGRRFGGTGQFREEMGLNGGPPVAVQSPWDAEAEAYAGVPYYLRRPQG